ncbi:MAG TPA: CehA/McbA family metallohydrolase [Bacteroidota bacterium]
MIDITPYSLLLPFLLYAETHYRFRYFLSYLKKPEPEILADAPHWIEPDKQLPLLLLCKDAHIYPCTLQQATARISHQGTTIKDLPLLDSPIALNTPYWWKVCALDAEIPSGWIDIDITFDIEIHGKRKFFKNDNYRTSSHAALRIYKGKEPLPHIGNFYLGDCHTHSTFTEDQVEFGAPLEASVQLCKSMGLSFFCVTDHSYDLDDKTDTYLENDPSLPKWKTMQETVDKLNSGESAFSIVRGEEVSSRNAQGENVHLALLGNKQYFPGSGDSAERWLQTRSEMSIREILLAKESDTIAVAAHPCDDVPLLQRLLLGRGEWSFVDLSNEQLTGIQFVNGELDAGFKKGYHAWVECLLRGQKVFVFGGNDAHGNFNRFRQIGIPFVKIHEADQQLFGRARTGVFLRAPLGEAELLNSMRRGNTLVTDGPLFNIRVNGADTISALGETFRAQTLQLECEALSSSDLGDFEEMRVYKGVIGSGHEEILYSLPPAPIKSAWKILLTVDIEQPMYIRAEAFTRATGAYDQRSHFVLTNPVWLHPA